MVLVCLGLPDKNKTSLGAYFNRLPGCGVICFFVSVVPGKKKGFCSTAPPAPIYGAEPMNISFYLFVCLSVCMYIRADKQTNKLSQSVKTMIL